MDLKFHTFLCLAFQTFLFHIKEAEKLGFKTCIIPENNKKLLKENYKLDIIGVSDILDDRSVFVT